MNLETLRCVENRQRLTTGDHRTKKLLRSCYDFRTIVKANHNTDFSCNILPPVISKVVWQILHLHYIVYVDWPFLACRLSKKLKSVIAVFVFEQLHLIFLCVSAIHARRTICKDYTPYTKARRFLSTCESCHVRRPRMTTRRPRDVFQHCAALLPRIHRVQWPGVMLSVYTNAVAICGL